MTPYLFSLIGQFFPYTLLGLIKFSHLFEKAAHLSILLFLSERFRFIIPMYPENRQKSSTCKSLNLTPRINDHAAVSRSEVSGKVYTTTYTVRKRIQQNENSPFSTHTHSIIYNIRNTYDEMLSKALLVSISLR